MIQKIPVVRNVLEANERIAEENRELFRGKGLLVLNLMSSPGAGKTTLLEKTIDRLSGRLSLGVVEGDIQTSQDAERIHKKGAPVVQINTDGACHLDANMVREAVKALDLAALDLLIIENVGNLVCPAEFDVGETCKVMIHAITEGEDKPAKYPLMFSKSSVVLINKMDLLPYLEIDLEKIRQESRKLNPRVVLFEVSARTGEGLDPWIQWIIDQKRALIPPL
jgi:hydrogenase nickel incorporation protein HypB